MPVGVRLANLALKIVYNHTSVVTDGPQLASSAFSTPSAHGLAKAVELTFVSMGEVCREHGWVCRVVDVGYAMLSRHTRSASTRTCLPLVEGVDHDVKRCKLSFTMAAMCLMSCS